MFQRSAILKLCSLFAPLVDVGVCSVCKSDPPGWRLAWEDDFQTFDEAKWIKVDTNVPTNNSLQDYLPEQVAVNRGRLVITSENEPSRGLPYRSGQVISRSEQRYGRWEVRARLPTSQGMWPAIWLLPDVQRFPWPSGGEIDIVENRGNQPHLTSSAFHYGSNQPYRHDFVYSEQQTALGAGLVDYHDSFHTYAVDWTDRYVRFYVDGVHHYTVHDEDVGGFLSQNTAPMQLVINTAIGGTFLPNPDESTIWPQTLDVDWVRVYEPAPNTFEAVFANGGFDQPGAAALSGWSVFGNELADNPNVRAADEAVADGDASLKLFGAFGRGGSFSGVSQGMTVTGGATVTASLDSFVRSQDSIVGTDNSALLKIEFYSEFGAKHGSQQMINEQQIAIAAGDSPEDVWRQHELTVVTPDGAVEARIALVFSQPGAAPGAVHIDNVNFVAIAPGAADGDFNGDGQVDGADYSLWRDSLGDSGSFLAADADGDRLVTVADYEIWRSNFGRSTGRNVIALPSPGAFPTLVAALAAGLSLRQSFACGGVFTTNRKNTN